MSRASSKRLPPGDGENCAPASRPPLEIHGRERMIRNEGNARLNAEEGRVGEMCGLGRFEAQAKREYTRSNPEVEDQTVWVRVGLKVGWTANHACKPHGCLYGGGEGGIRTHGRLAPTPDFESGTFDHSATSPLEGRHYRGYSVDVNALCRTFYAVVAWGAISS